MIEHADTAEKGFQKLIVDELLEKQGYIETFSNDFDREFCINKKELFEFIEDSQLAKYDFIKKKNDRKFLNRLNKKIKRKGILEVLRNGIKYYDKTIDVFYPKPSSEYNIKDRKRYEANIFSVTQELIYTDNNKNRLDLVIFINGLPIITMELKNPYTYQGVRDSINQYKFDRDPSDTIFNFGRCIVHFAVDTDLIYMTTKLKGKDSFFIPFNKGLNDGSPFPPFGAGNPQNYNGEKTAYLWEEILSQESLSNIIAKFANIIEERNEESGKVKNKLIFPRYHQLKVVNDLLEDTKEKGVGNRYLIQHSAGSGKSFSITWLAHQLINLYNKDNKYPLFDSVVVVTDRKILDRQIKENIKSFAHVKKVLEWITGNTSDIKSLDPTEDSISKSVHMRLALENNKRIIVCTVQTFPYVLDVVKEMPSKQIGFIIDEAHSSQNGQAAASMNALFSEQDLANIPKDEDGFIDTEDLLNYLVESKKMLSNANYYAFTATPKNKTLETFGTKQNDGSFKPFHTYSMKQAIEEEFILDVLENYTTYRSYYKIQKRSSVSDQKEYDTEIANKKLKHFAENSKDAIYDKSKIMINHFIEHTRHLINNKAKAMVVTRSIKAAMKYKDSFDEYLEKIDSPYKAIVSFSGKKAHYKTGEKLTESKMNNFEDGNNNIPKQFKKDKFKFLIVARKYQTGFDEPLLHTMYVDKKLSGVQAVQTLSRLNRASNPDKNDTFVLDFYNDVEDIKSSFSNYYTTTVLSEETDVNKLNDLEDELSDFQIYHKDEVKKFFKLYYSNNERNELAVIINGVVSIFNNELSKDKKVEFKSNAKSFVRTYSYLSKLIEFNQYYWEELWLFLKHLIPKLKIESDEDDQNILKDVNLDNYQINKIGNTKIYLDEEEGEIKPIPIKSGGMIKEKNLDTLENIISDFNRRFGNIDWGEGVDPEEAEEILKKKIPDKLRADIEIIESIKNSDQYNAKITSDKEVKSLMKELITTHTSIYKKFADDPDFKDNYLDFIFDILWKNSKKY